MKINAFAAILTASLALVPLARADEPVAEKFPDRAAAAGQVWKEKLGLTPGQLAKFLAALKTKDAELQPLRDQYRDAVRKLHSQLSENAPERDLQASLQRILSLRAAISSWNDQFDASLASFLSPTQRAKLFVWESTSAQDFSAPESQAGDFQEPADVPEEPE